MRRRPCSCGLAVQVQNNGKHYEVNLKSMLHSFTVMHVFILQGGNSTTHCFPVQASPHLNYQSKCESEIKKLYFTGSHYLSWNLLLKLWQIFSPD